MGLVAEDQSRAASPPHRRRWFIAAVTIALAVLLALLVRARVARPDPSDGFEDVSAKVGIELRTAEQTSVWMGRKRVPYGVLSADLDGDGWVDLVYLNHGDTPSLYRNEAGKGFVDRFEGSGLRGRQWEYPQQSDRHGAACADFDNDGAPDLFISHGAMRGETLGVKYDELLRNLGGLKFEDVSKEAGPLNSQGRGRTGAWADYDNDGLVDLLVSNYETPVMLYRNRGGASFQPAAGLPEGMAALRVTWTDYDGDGDPDLLLAAPTRLLRNLGDGSFADATRESGLGKGPRVLAFSVAWGDVDNDGDLDLYLVAGRPERSQLYLNEGGSFRRSPHRFGAAPDEDGAGAKWGDLDNDGDVDLLVLTSRRVHFFENRGGGRLAERPLPGLDELRPGAAGDLELLDYDRDGGLDVAVNGALGRYLYRNVFERGAWLELVLVGERSNRGGVGARVEALLPDGRRVAREQLANAGVAHSAGCGPLHLGLGAARKVDLRVRWPSGVVQTLPGVAVNQVLRVLEEVSGRPSAGKETSRNLRAAH